MLGKKTGTESKADLFEASLLKTKHLIPHARSADAASLHVRAKDADVKLTGLEDDRQKIELREADGSLLLRIRRVVPPAGATGKRPLASPAPRSPRTSRPPPCCRPTIRSSRSRPRRPSARRPTPGRPPRRSSAGSTRPSATRTRRGLRSALQVCKGRGATAPSTRSSPRRSAAPSASPRASCSASCTSEGSLGGHAWTEVWIEGRWYALDATLGMGSADALHLSLGRLSLAEGAEGAEMMEFIDLMGGLEVDVREITWEGKTLRVDAAAVTVRARAT